jgi:transcriptional regulator with XRE-family HTH domain
MNELGNFLREQRLKAHLTITDLVVRSGLSLAFLSQIETGKRKPSMKAIEKIASALGIEKADILEHQKDVMIVKTTRVSHNLKLHKLIETLENANLQEHELDYIIDQAYLTLKYIQSK